MGCGASVRKRRLTDILGERQKCCQIVIQQPSKEDSEEATRRPGEDDVLSLGSSPSTSVRSIGSAVSSLHSRRQLMTMGKRVSMNSRSNSMGMINDDMMSDVPTIAESIANMDDLVDLASLRIGIGAADDPLEASKGSPTVFRSSVRSPGIDARPHPFAPCLSSSSLDSHVSLHPNATDIGNVCDVPSLTRTPSDNPSCTSGRSKLSWRSGPTDLIRNEDISLVFPRMLGDLEPRGREASWRVQRRRCRSTGSTPTTTS